MFNSLRQLLNSYQLYEVIVEMAVIWVCVYLVIRFLRGTRGAGVIKGVIVLLVVVTLLIRLLGQTTDAFGRLSFIYTQFLGLLAILMIVVFQPELRQAMIRIGHTRLLGFTNRNRSHVIDAVVEAVELLSKQQVGALIAIEREVKLGNLVAGGEELDARVSARLLGSIFWPNSPLHDLGVVIRGDRVVAANVQFPLAEDVLLPLHYGSRHRAAVGVTLESDCIAVIVSEETGRISLAEQGRIEPNIAPQDVAEALRRKLEVSPNDDKASASVNASTPANDAAPSTAEEPAKQSDTKRDQPPASQTDEPAITREAV